MVIGLIRPIPAPGCSAERTSRTGPFQAFTVSDQAKIWGVDKPNGAIYSVPLDGGEWRVEAFGIHNPRGLAFNKFGSLYMTNDGMELRGTRPVKDDPDSLLKVGFDVWYGWPDYSTDGHPVSDYQPPLQLLLPSGYSELSFLIDHETSNLHAFAGTPDALVAGVFMPLAGAAKFSFAPDAGPFKNYSGNAIVAMDGDRAPFATSGMKMLGRSGFKVARVDIDTKQVKDFIRNTAGVPASEQPFGTIALDAPSM